MISLYRSKVFLLALVISLLIVSTLFKYHEDDQIRPRPQVLKGKPSKSTSTLLAETDLVDEEHQYHTSDIIHKPLSANSHPNSISSLRGKPKADFKTSKSSISQNEYMKDILNWRRPQDKDSHWPYYRDYKNRDYDPNRWEGFPL
jgi:hypothetical protein